MDVIQQRLRGCTVLAGFGTSGREAVVELVRGPADPTAVIADQGSASPELAARGGRAALLERDVASAQPGNPLSAVPTGPGVRDARPKRLESGTRIVKIVAREPLP